MRTVLDAVFEPSTFAEFAAVAAVDGDAAVADAFVDCVVFVCGVLRKQNEEQGEKAYHIDAV